MYRSILSEGWYDDGSDDEMFSYQQIYQGFFYSFQKIQEKQLLDLGPEILPRLLPAEIRQKIFINIFENDLKTYFMNF